jgi:hypothetical protein
MDDLLVSDISDAKSNDRPLRVEWQKRGTKRVILSAREVAE